MNFCSLGFHTWLKEPGVVEIPAKNHHWSDQFLAPIMTFSEKDFRNEKFRSDRLDVLRARFFHRQHFMPIWKKTWLQVPGVVMFHPSNSLKSWLQVRGVVMFHPSNSLKSWQHLVQLRAWNMTTPGTCSHVWCLKMKKLFTSWGVQRMEHDYTCYL